MKDKKICVIGAGLSGIYASALAAHKNADTFLSEGNKTEIPQKHQNILNKYNVEFELGGHTDKIKGFDTYIISPGIPKDSSIYKRLEKFDASIISEIELASRFAKNDKIIAITGTNGKSTTVKLVRHIFQDTNKQAYLGGNIGIPFSKLILETEDIDGEKIYILEISSFQMEDIENFKPEIAAILNISPDHMDRYENVEDYMAAKLRITENQDKQDIYFYNNKDKMLKNNIPANTTAKGFNNPETYNDLVQLKHDGSIKTTTGEQLHIRGRHNFENVLAALSIMENFDLSKDHILEKLVSFKGLEHRLEFVKDISGIKFYNDSKSTNIDSVIQALHSFSDSIILILGGQDKDLDFTKLIPHLKNVKKVALIGAARNKIQTQLGDNITPLIGKSMEDIIKKTYKYADSGDIILLSPGCASFDMYENYKERGDNFKNIVNKIE